MFIRCDARFQPSTVPKVSDSLNLEIPHVHIDVDISIIFQGSLYHQPKHCIWKGQSLKITIHWHCLIPPLWVMQTKIIQHKVPGTDLIFTSYITNHQIYVNLF